MVGWLINDDLKSMWTEAFLAWFKIPSRHLSGVTDKNHEKPQSVTPVWGPIFEPGTSQHEAGVLTTRSPRSVVQYKILFSKFDTYLIPVLRSWCLATSKYYWKIISAVCIFVSWFFSSSLSHFRNIPQNNPVKQTVYTFFQVNLYS
jgi:hypothetical protein